MAEAPLDELQWRSPEWIQAFGLRTDNVLEYFSQSPFYDRTSNNQVLKMQLQFNEKFHHLTNADINNELIKMKGIEFVIAYVREPDFWIVRKQNRINNYQTETVSDYYIVGANIYMAPIVYSVLSSRLLGTTLSLKNSLAKLQEMPIFSPSQGYTYPSPEPSADSNKSKTSYSTPFPNTSTNFSTPGSFSGAAATANSGSDANTEYNKMRGISSNTLNNLLNICLKNNVTYLEDVPTSGPGSTLFELGINGDSTTQQVQQINQQGQQGQSQMGSSLKNPPAIARRMKNINK